MCPQLSLGERRSRGTAAAAQIPPQAHRGWKPAPGRPSPVLVLAEQEADRQPDLVPVRHGRMMISPFTFYRGAAAVMSQDLRGTPVAGLPAQLCGDAHLSNFGVFGSPERRLVFDLNDFDETLPGPFEYDVKRMVTSFVIAARDNGLSASDAKAAAREAAAAYRTAMAVFAELSTMDVWYASLDEDTIRAMVRETMDDIGKAEKSAKSGKKRERARERAKMAKRAAKRAARAAEKARTRDSMQALSKLGESVGGSLLQGRDAGDLLFLQVKEATSSVLEVHLPRSRYREHGQRVVHGQRLMQAASDIYLGWTRGPRGRDFYWRQLRDMKGSAEIEAMTPLGLNAYARACGWTLARAHARSGDPVAIAAYLGETDEFDRSVTNFAIRYADQNERDYAEFVAAIRSGQLTAVEGV